MRNWLKVKRKQARITMSEISNLIGISAPSYCNIENGHTNPTVENAKKIAGVLGFDWTMFYDDETGGDDDAEDKHDGKASQ